MFEAEIDVLRMLAHTLEEMYDLLIRIPVRLSYFWNFDTL